MPKIAAERLEEIGRALFVAAGTPQAEAALVMRHIVGANLVGHDSHGVIQIPTYIDRIKVGHIVPGAPWVIVKESPNHTVIDGHWAFGYVANDKAMRLTIEKAEKGNVAAARKYLVALVPIKKGEILSESNVGVLRTGEGVSAMQYWDCLGKAAGRSYSRGEPIRP